MKNACVTTNRYISAYKDDAKKYDQYISPQCEFFIVKNKKSEAIAVDESYASHAGYKNPVDCLGISDYGLKSTVCALAPKFIEEDQFILNTNKKSIHLLLANYYKRELDIYIYTKQQQEDNIICNVWLAKSSMAQSLIRKQIQVVPCALRNNINMVYDVIETYDQLSMRESQVLYFLMQFQSSTEIGEQLKLSKRTIQHYIENIKMKLSCITTKQVMEYCFFLGYQKKVPLSLINIA